MNVAGTRPSSSAGRGRSRSASSTASTSAIGALIDQVVGTGLVPTVVTFDPHPREVLGYGVELLPTLERRLELLAELGIEETLVVEFTPEVAALSPEAFAAVATCSRSGAELVAAGPGFRFGHHRSGDLQTFARLGADVREAPLVPGVSATRIRQLIGDRRRARGGGTARTPGGGRGDRRLGRRPRRHARLSDGEPPDRALAARAALRHLRGLPRSTTGRRSRSASTRTTAATSGGSRRSCSTSRATSTGSASSSSSGSGSATRPCSRARPSSSRRSRATSRRRERRSVLERSMGAELPELVVRDARAWRRWLGRHHHDSPGVWLVLAKKGVEAPTSLRHQEALEEALCHGWIDGQAATRDEATFRQRFTPRRQRSVWSRRNTEIAERLQAEGRMRPAGLAEVVRAKADGRWEAAYAGPATIEVPPELEQALRAEPGARRRVRAAQRAEPIRDPLSDRDREARRDAGASHRAVRRDARAGRDDLPAEAASALTSRIAPCVGVGRTASSRR